MHLQMLASEDGHVIDAFQLYKPLAWKPAPAQQAAIMRTFVPHPPDSWLDRVGISFGTLDQVRAGQLAEFQCAMLLNFAPCRVTSTCFIDDRAKLTEWSLQITQLCLELLEATPASYMDEQNASLVQNMNGRESVAEVIQVGPNSV